VVVAGLSAAVSAVLVGGMAAADQAPATPTPAIPAPATPAPEPSGGVVRLPIVTRPSTPPVTRSHAS
jgi:hypothetical protein